eukprot:scaffold125286_cov63-Phaeocystis_antarctica.AAC.2
MAVTNHGYTYHGFRPRQCHPRVLVRLGRGQPAREPATRAAVQCRAAVQWAAVFSECRAAVLPQPAEQVLPSSGAAWFGLASAPPPAAPEGSAPPKKKRPATPESAPAPRAKKEKASVSKGITTPYHQFCREQRPLQPPGLCNRDREKLLGEFAP